MQRLQVNPSAALKNVERLLADLERKDAELAKFKFDGDTQRAERIKTLADALTIGVP